MICLKPSSVRQQQKTKQENQHVPLVNPFHKSLVTVWRAHMMLMTVICILAVDFPAFPRSFGKTESWGTSLVRRLALSRALEVFVVS